MVRLSLLTIGILVILYSYVVNLFLRIESFKDADFITHNGYPTDELCAPPLTTEGKLSGPANATLDTPRDPYHLLGDYLEPATSSPNLTSESTYMGDGQRKIELTGTYGQVTNNYKRSKPDNGSTLLKDLSLSFYK